MEDTSILEIWVQDGRLSHHDVAFADVTVRIPTVVYSVAAAC